MNEIIIYKAKDRKTQIDVKFEHDAVWLTQQQMAELFVQTKQNISLHINNCFKEKELRSVSVVKESLTTETDGKKYKTKFFNLDFFGSEICIFSIKVFLFYTLFNLILQVN